jgi:hypothetical protein
MAPTTFILTSSPFVLGQIALASFIPNIRQPHQDAKRPYAAKASDYSVQPDDDFEGLINTSSKSFLNIFATKFAAVSFQHDKSSMLHVTAQKGNIYSLNNPNNLFDEIVFGKETGGEMQRWFEHCKRYKTEPRFVVAYRTFIDAQVSSDQHSTTDISGKATAPISTAQGDLSGTADVEIQAGRQTNTDAKGDMKTPGERIYGICYRKINISCHEGKSMPLLEQTNKWKPFAAARGESDVEEYFQADLLDGDDTGGCNVYETEATGGQKITFGIPSQESRNYWAVLIGIDHYTSYRNLNGCVQDVEDVEQLLRSRLSAMPLHITKLTASGPNEPRPPTYDNVLAALTTVQTNAKPGDFVYIHFSGHGSRLKSQHDPQHPKQPLAGNHLHEVLVLEGDKHLKDFELGKFLDDLASKGLFLFVVLDCCHSGGADRVADDSDDNVRGIDDLVIFDAEETDAASQPPTGDATAGQLGLTRDASSWKSYWQRPRNYTVLAACQPHEKAREFTHDGKTNGALTHWMIKSTGQLSSTRGTPTYQRLHRDIYATMFAEFPSQHPMLLGEGDRLLFGNDNFRGIQAAYIDEITKARLFIDIGEVHGVRVGEEYAVYQRSALGLDSDPIIANIIIDQVGGLRSSAKMPATSNGVELGCLVKLLTPVLDDPVHVKVQSPEMLQSLQEVSQTQGGSARMHFHPFEDRYATYQVLSNECYQISDGTGQLLPNCPSIPADGEAAGKIHQVLQKLARYRMVVALHNKKSKLDGSFVFSVSGGVQSEQQTGITEVFDGDSVHVEFENLSDQTLYYTVFDLTPRWAVEQLIPWQTEDSLSVDPRTKSNLTEIEMEIPEALRKDDFVEIQEIFKVIVTTAPSHFGILQSQALPTRNADWRGDLPLGSPQELEGILQSLKGVSREGKVKEAQFGDWQTGEVAIKTKRREAHVS